MTPTVVTIGRTKYYTTGSAAAILRVSHQTLHRWAAKAGNGCGGVLAGLRFFRHPVNRFHFFTVASVMRVKNSIDRKRRINRRLRRR
ncbi:MAG: hypothetical protein V1907_03345 [Candidatus Kerfeldbacteria bacterium]